MGICSWSQRTFPEHLLGKRPRARCWSMTKTISRVNGDWVLVTSSELRTVGSALCALTHLPLTTLKLIRCCQARPYRLGQTSSFLPHLPGVLCQPGGRGKTGAKGRTATGQGGEGTGKEELIWLSEFGLIPVGGRRGNRKFEFLSKVIFTGFGAGCQFSWMNASINLPWFSNLLTKLIFIFMSILVLLQQTPLPL